MNKTFILYILFSFIFISWQKSTDNLNGIYLIKNNEEFLCLDLLPELSFINIKVSNNNLFRIKHIDNKNDNLKTDNDNYYFIEEIESNKKLGLNNNGKDILIYDEKKVDNKDKLIWKLIPSNKKNANRNTFYIQNKYNSLYLGTNSPISKSTHQIKINCSFKNLNNNNIFKLLKMFEENVPNNNSEALNNEKIDIIINYNNKNTNTKDVSSNKYEDKDELKYVLRSILKNIPWINKIFILLYNDNIFFMKEKEDINEKIIYVKIIDLLGFESNSNSVINFNLKKMEKFGLNENFLYMNDNYYIGKPINKSYFFTEENSKILPLLISNKFNEIYYNELDNDYKRLASRKRIINIDSSEGIKFSKVSSLKILFESFFNPNKFTSLIIPEYNMNTIPLNLNEINTIYDIVKEKYKFYNDALFSIDNNINSLDFFTLILSYMKNVKNRKVTIIPYNQYYLNDFNKKLLNNDNIFPLFSIHHQKNKKYSSEDYNIEKKKLNTLFQKPCKYEIYFGEYDPNEKDTIKKKINNIIHNIKKFEILNYEYGKKRRSVYRKNHHMKRKINNLGKKTNEILKIIPKLETYISNLENNNINITKLMEIINDIEKKINFLNLGFNEIIEYNSGFFTLKVVIFIIIVILIIFIVGFRYYRSIVNNQILVFNIEDEEEFGNNFNSIKIDNNNINENDKGTFDYNKDEMETTKLKEIII